MLLYKPSQIQKPDSNLKLLLHDKQLDSNGPLQAKQVSSQGINAQFFTPTSMY